MRVEGSTSWGDDITGINTFLRDASRGLYNLYVTDPSEQQIRAYSPAADGSGFPAAPTAWLATARDLTRMSSTYVDGDFFAIDGGAVVRFVSGKDDGWDPGDPQDALLRPAPAYTLVAGAGERRVGNVYAFDKPNARIIALDKTDGSYRGQYRLAGGAEDWSDLRAMYVIPGIEEAPPTVVWLSENAVHQAVLEAVPDVAPKATPPASPSAGDPTRVPSQARRPDRAS